jgi:tyrosine-specific transport protein
MNYKKQYLLTVTALLFGSAESFAVWKSEHNRLVGSPTVVAVPGRTSKVLFMKKQPKDARNVKRLSASSVSEQWSETSALRNDLPKVTTWESTVFPVLSTSLLITGNTVGAGMLVLPELAAGPGIAIATSIFGAAFLINLISGLLIAEVAIYQHATKGNDVPSSFKEFAQANLPGNQETATVANFISAISVMVNALVLAFNTAKVGDFGYEALQGLIPADLVSWCWILACVVLVGTQTFAALSSIASVLVVGLFASFAGLLLPGLANLETGPLELLLNTPGTSSDILGSACQLAPIVLMSLVYQNIVPTVTKMLDYDRAKSMAAIALGSFVPLGMYVAWAFCVLGGGVDMGNHLDGPLITLFTLTTIAGSSIGCVMSLAEEFDTFVKDGKSKAQDDVGAARHLHGIESNEQQDDKFSLTSVLLSVACSTIALQFFQNDLNGALKVAGSFGSPLLYGVLPVLMAYTQRKERGNADKLPSPPLPTFELPNASIGILGVASTGFVGNELFQSAQEVMATAML